MTKVTDMEQWIQGRMTAAEKYVESRGCDMQITMRTNCYSGRLSHAPEDVFGKVKRLMDAVEETYGEAASVGVISVYYDDKQYAGHTIGFLESFMRLHGIELPEGYTELGYGFDCVVPVTFDGRDG